MHSWALRQEGSSTAQGSLGLGRSDFNARPRVAPAPGMRAANVPYEREVGPGVCVGRLLPRASVAVYIPAPQTLRSPGPSPLALCPPHPQGKDLDYEAMAREHRALAQLIREHGGGPGGGRLVEPPDRLIMRAQVGAGNGRVTSDTCRSIKSWKQSWGGARMRGAAPLGFIKGW